MLFVFNLNTHNKQQHVNIPLVINVNRSPTKLFSHKRMEYCNTLRPLPRHTYVDVGSHSTPQIKPHANRIRRNDPKSSTHSVAGHLPLAPYQIQMRCAECTCSKTAKGASCEKISSDDDAHQDSRANHGVGLNGRTMYVLQLCKHSAK